MSASGGQSRTRQILAAAQFCLSMMLIGAGLYPELGEPAAQPCGIPD
jgi:hypothetical protein